MRKRCPKCKETKDIGFFYKSAARYDGYDCYCKTCQKKTKQTPKGIKMNRDAHRKFMFGVTGNEYDTMVKHQNGVCAICGNPETKIHHMSGRVQELSVDHNHETGKVRELLCFGCNLVIAHAQEDIGILSKAITYLEKHKAH